MWRGVCVRAVLEPSSEETSRWSVASGPSQGRGDRASVPALPVSWLRPRLAQAQACPSPPFSPVPDRGQEQYEEYFMASSAGEQWQVTDMAQQEDDIPSETATIRDHLLDLTLCFNLAGIMVFL